MNKTQEGGELEVTAFDEFIVERRVYSGGAVTVVKVPDGVEHLGSKKSGQTGGFGERIKVDERFKCLHPGEFEVIFESGRPWEEKKIVVKTIIFCH